MRGSDQFLPHPLPVIIHQTSICSLLHGMHTDRLIEVTSIGVVITMVCWSSHCFRLLLYASDSMAVELTFMFTLLLEFFIL